MEELKSRHRYPRNVTFLKGSLKELTEYGFNTMKVAHFFCPTCGSTVFGKQMTDDVIYGVNLRVVEGIDLKSVKTSFFDGKNIL